MPQKVLLTLFSFVLITIALVPLSRPEAVKLPREEVGSIGGTFKSGTILFVGDVLLGRHVERLMREYGAEYPFLETGPLLAKSDVTIGNFEGAVPEKHVPTPDFTFTFSVDARYLDVLHNVGFDILSLANNHAFDYEVEGYHETKVHCVEAELQCLGHPKNVPQSATTSIMVGDTNVGLLFLNAVGTKLTEADVTALLQNLSRETHLQIAYIHWGIEYELLHSTDQKALAHILIDHGVDAVVGHHPHVVQDIEVYENRPIFYSLGNFVFDQYFSEDVQTGLVLQLEIEEGMVSYTLIPVSSVVERSQPRIMPVLSKHVFFESLSVTGAEKQFNILHPKLVFPFR